MSEFVQSVINYFSDWSRGEILALLAILVPIVIGITWIIIRFFVRIVAPRPLDANGVFRSIRAIYAQEVPDARLPDAARSDAKLLFYQGRSTRSAQENVLLGLPAQRDILPKILDTISKWDGKSPLHIEIVGDRKQGKSILLAQIAVELRESNEYTLLMQYEETEDAAFDFELLKNYLRLKAPKWYTSVLQPRKVRRLVVFLDDFLAYYEDALAPRKSSFLRQILNSRLPILLVTSSRTEVGTSKSVKFELFLTANDEEGIVSKLKEPPALVPPSLTVSSVRGTTGGYRIYRGELMAFLSLLVQEVAKGNPRFTAGFRELDLELDDVGKNALKYIAACQLVDVELPSGILKYAVPEVNTDRLVSDARGWVQLKPLSYSHDGRGLSLGAPYFAAFGLDSFRVSDKFALEKLFVDILEGLAKKRITDWSSYEGEFVRHILYRLAKGRHFRFHGINGVELAQSLYRRFGQVLLEYVQRMTDTRLLCLWAATLARLRQQEQTKPMCLRILERLTRSSERLDGQAFVALALTLNSLTDSDLREAGLATLHLQEVMRQSADPPTEEEMRRMNQSIHAYCNLLKELGRYEEALSVLEHIPTRIRPDALTTLLKAEMTGILGDGRADDTYVQAVTLAEEVVRRSPEMMVECLLGYGDFLLRSAAWGDLRKRSELSYGKAAEYMKYSPEKYQKMLSSWAQSISEENPRKAFNLYQESLEIDRQNQTVHVNSHIGFARLLLNHAHDFYQKEEDAYKEAERLCRKVLDYPALEFGEMARVYRILGEQVVGSKIYIWEGKRPRPDFSEAEDLILKAFDSDSEIRSDDARKTLADSLAHRSLARLYWHWHTKHADQSRDSQLADKAIFHFTKSYSRLPRRDLDGLNVRLSVLNCRYDYIRVKRDRRESVLPECVDMLELLEKWRLARVWYRTWAFLLICIDTLRQADLSMFRKQFDEMYHQIQRIIGTDRESLSKLVILTTNKLKGRAFTLMSIGQGDNAPEYLNKAFNMVSQHLENNPEDTKAAQTVSRVVIGKRQREIEGNQDRIDKAVELTKRAVGLRPTNEGALESLLRVADILPHDDQRLTELENMLSQLLDGNDSVVHALQNVLRRFQEQSYWVNRGRLTKRLLRYIKHMELVNSGTK